MLSLKQKFLLIVLFLTAGLGLFAVLVVYVGQKAAINEVLADNGGLLIIDYGQGKERWFTGQIIEGMTVLDVLKTSSVAGNFEFTANGQLVALDGFSSNKEGKWRCYLNGREIKEGLNKRTVQVKDEISCRL